MSEPPPSTPKAKQPSDAAEAARSSNLGSLLQKIERILTTEDVSVRGLANAAGLDPNRDFRGIYLNGVPLSGQDLSGFDFSGSDLRNTGVQKAKRDRTTVFESAIFDGPSLDQKVIAFNKRLRDIPFHEMEAKLTELLNSGRRQFDVISFTTVIRRAPNAARAAHWYEEMQKAGVVPDVMTFNTLINKTAGEQGATRWYEEMQKAGVAPNEITRAVLAKKGIDD